MSADSPNKIQVSKKTARRLMLACQHLFPPRRLKGKAGIQAFLQKVRSIQFDPINVVGRNPDLVLQSRVKNYKPEMLDELLYQDRVLIDNWDKMASLSLAEDWPYFSRHRSRMEDIFGVPSEVVMTLAPDVINQIKEQGPQSPLDFKHEQKTDWAWEPTRVGRAALEGLFKMGKLGVHHRVSNRRYFDLIENLLPVKILEKEDPNSTLDDYQAWHVLRRIQGMGLAHPNAGEQWGGMIGVKSLQRRKIIEQLVDQGYIVRLEVIELPGEEFYLRGDDLNLLEQVSRSKTSPQAAFIAPLDNLLWDRKSLERLFDFSYAWEVYKPKKNREYGYYVLPVLLGDQFIGRFEPEFDKKTRLLTVNDWWWEEGYQPTGGSDQALKRCMLDFVTYLDVGDIRYSKRLLKKGGLDWLGEL
jgi:uncharacterized protein YcaQ